MELGQDFTTTRGARNDKNGNPSYIYHSEGFSYMKNSSRVNKNGKIPLQ